MFILVREYSYCRQ